MKSKTWKKYINIHSMRFQVFLYCMILILIPMSFVSYMTYRISYGVIRDQTDSSEKMILNQT